MQIVYAKETLPQTSPLGIFLAGPTPRRKDVQSWRPDALRILEDQGYEGTVYVPEARDGTWKPDEYEMQVEWEEAALNKAACILFWVPRKMDTLPGLVTNVEFGVWQGSGKVVFGAPLDAEKVRYLLYYAVKLNIPAARTLEATVALAIERAQVYTRAYQAMRADLDSGV